MKARGHLLKLSVIDSTYWTRSHNRYWNARLDRRKNFYGLKLNSNPELNLNLNDFSRNLIKTLEMSRDFMSKKDMWKLFLTTILMELQAKYEEDGYDEEDLQFNLGCDRNILGEKADFVIYRSNSDIPILIAEINELNTKSFDPTRMQRMMTQALVEHNYKNYAHWPLPELRHLPVYGLIVNGNEFHICKMVMMAEKQMKFALLFTFGKRPETTPYNLFTFSTFPASLNYKCDCGCARSQHDKNVEILSQLLGGMRIDGEVAADHDSIIFKRPNRGSVTAVINLLQMVLRQHQIILCKEIHLG